MAKLSIGIVGLPNVGKSTLFKVLTKKQIDIANYPFCTIEPNVGVVQVPDERLGKLAAFSGTKKIIPAVIEFVDIAGLVKGASEGEGLGNKFLANIREVDAIAEVVRIFENGNITHVHNTIDPENDIDVIETELVLADMETVNKRLEKLQKETKTGDKEALRKKDIIEKIKKVLDEGRPAREVFGNKGEGADNDDDFIFIKKDIQLLTFKPILYIYNGSTGLTTGFSGKEELSPELAKKNHVVLDIKTEEDLDEMSEEDKKDLGLESNIDKLITEAYRLLGLKTFITTGVEETRAWTFKEGWAAPKCGSVIHNDFEQKFIRATVINWQDLINAGSQAQAREKGLIRTEGKEYIMKDGDVVEFLV